MERTPERMLQPEQPKTENEVAKKASTAQTVEEVLGAEKSEFARFILSKEEVPQRLIDKYPVLFDKVFALTNIQDKSGKKFFKDLLHFNITLERIFGGAHYERTAQDEKDIGLLQAYFNAQIRRSQGGKLRERLAFNTANILTEKPELQEAGGGITQKIKGFFKK